MIFLIIGIPLAILFLIFLFPPVKVCGVSMQPTLFDGDILFSRRVLFPKREKFAEESVYVYRPPVGENSLVIKRLTSTRNNGSILFFEGDNSLFSFDSRMYGGITKDRVVAKCLPYFIRYRRKEKTKWFRAEKLSR